MILLPILALCLVEQTPLQAATEALSAADYEIVENVLLPHWSSFHGAELAEALRIWRRATFRLKDYPTSFDLLGEEIMLRRSLQGETCPVDSKFCDAIEVGFIFATMQSSERSSASASWLAQYLNECAIHPEQEARYHYMLAQVADAAGDVMGVWDELLTTISLAERHGTDPLIRLGAQSNLAVLSARLGKPQFVAPPILEFSSQGQGQEEFDTLSHSNAAIAAYTNVAWSALLLRESGYAVAVQPTQFLRSALALATTKGPGYNVQAVPFLRICLALAAVQENDPRAALAHLHEIPSRSSLSSEHGLWLALVKTRAHILSGEWAEAHASLMVVDRWVEVIGDVESRWLATSLHGLFHDKRGDVGAALEHYMAAETILDELVLPIALGQARDHYIHDLQRRARALISLQIQEGMIAQAHCTTRMARGRVQRALAIASHTPSMTNTYEYARGESEKKMAQCHTLQGRRRREECATQVEMARRQMGRNFLDVVTSEPERLSISCDDLAAPLPGELVLTYVRLEDGWRAFAVLGQRIRVARLGRIDHDAEPSVLSEILLREFSDELTQALRLRILATEELHSVDFHMLPWRGAPLVAHLPVAYSLDLPHSIPETVATNSAVVVVADPTATTSADDEGLYVYSHLENSGLSAEFSGPGQATRAGVLSQIGQAPFHLYFGGHGGRISDPGRDFDMWDNSLHLDQQTSISVEDILVAVAPGTAPATMVLLACMTGLVDSETFSGGIGLAQAFLLRGSHAVVGTTEPIEDSVTHVFSQEFYDSVQMTPSFDIVEHLADTQARLIEQGFTEKEVGKFRIFTR